MLLAVLCALLLSAGVAERARAEYPPDTDGEVPLIWECFGLDDEGMPDGQHRWAKTTVRAWPSAKDPKEYRNEVRIDWCKVFSDGGGFYDLYRIYRHEMAHAKYGRGHYEGSSDPLSPDYNPAYYPNTSLTGL